MCSGNFLCIIIALHDASCAIARQDVSCAQTVSAWVSLIYLWTWPPLLPIYHGPLRREQPLSRHIAGKTHDGDLLPGSRIASAQIVCEPFQSRLAIKPVCESVALRRRLSI